MDYLHKKGIIHRDIKPSNILIGKKNVLKICDFGSAIREDVKIDGKFENEGFTTWYKSPEILFGDLSYDYSIDIWSLGCVFGEVIRGIPVFPGVNDFHMIGKITNLLGTPDESKWKDYPKMPNYGKIDFYDKDPFDFRDYFTEAKKSEILLLKKMIKYGKRNTAEKLLKSPFFKINQITDFHFHNKKRNNTSFQKIFNII